VVSLLVSFYPNIPIQLYISNSVKTISYLLFLLYFFNKITDPAYNHAAQDPYDESGSCTGDQK
jgi:hypothetical protein